MLYSSNVVLLFCIFSLSRQQKLVLLKKCQMLIFFFNKNQCRTKCLYDPCNEYNNRCLSNPLQKKTLLCEKNKNLGQWLSDNECFLICTCPVSYPNMGILKMKKSWNGVPKNQVGIEVRLLDIYLCYSL